MTRTKTIITPTTIFTGSTGWPAPQLLLDNSGAVVERIEYNAYGEADVTIVSGSGTGNV
jgi:uncharacterized NAD-dependent epimerase/dehydratase family protein